MGCIRSGTFKLYLVIRTRVFMAEQMFMFATTAGFIIGLGVLFSRIFSPGERVYCFFSEINYIKCESIEYGKVNEKIT